MTDIFLNGSFVPENEASIPVTDRGFLFGDGVYEVIPAYGGHLLRGVEHLERLERGLREIRMDSPMSPEQWLQVFERLLSAAPKVDQSIYLQVTRGAPPARDFRFPGDDVRPTVMAMAKVMTPRDPVISEYGVSAVTRADFRWQRCDIKSVALLAAVLLRQEADDNDAEEAILLRDGQVTEASSSNVFIVEDGVLITPPTGPLLLSGITRGLVIDLARKDGIEVREEPIEPARMCASEEVMITSSVREIMPVTRIDGKPIALGAPGALFRRLNDSYQQYKSRVRAGDV